MELNDIKKHLYKNKTLARIINVSKDGVLYNTRINNGSDVKEELWDIIFLVPLSDIGDAKFENEMYSQFLIRWIIKYEQFNI